MTDSPIKTNNMKRLLLFLAALPLYAVGTITQQFQQIANSSTWVLSINWTGDALNGSVPATPAQFGLAPVQGFRVFSVEIAPGTPAPTNNYNLALTTFIGDDILAGGGIALSSTLASSIAPPPSAPPLNGTLTIKITGNSTASAQGKVLVYFAPVAQVIALTGGGPGLPTNNIFTGSNTFTGSSTFTGGGSLQGLYTGGPTFSLANSPTGVTESGNVVTATTTLPCSFVANETITVSGVLVSGYNGGWPVVSGCSGNTFTYQVVATGLAPSGGGTAVGTPIFNGFTVNGGLHVTGNIIAPSISHLANINNIFYVDGVTYPTIQAAITAANPLPGTGCSNTNFCGVVIIPPEYTGTDTFTNTNLVTVWDWRRQLATGFPLGTLGTPGGLLCGFAAGFTFNPTSTDCRLMSFGPADTYISKSKVAATTTATLNPGQNTNVLISAVVNSSIDFSNIQTGTALNLLATPANQGLFIGRGTAAAENLTFNSTVNCPTASTWNVVDATHLCLNVVNTHSGTTDIEQGPGALKLDTNGLQFRTAQVRPGQDATNNLMAYISDNLGNVSFALPGNNASAPFPANNVTFPFGHGPCIMQTATAFGGNFPVPSAATCFTLGTNSALQATNSSGGFPGFIGPFISNNANAAGFPAMARLANTDKIAWRNAANNADDSIGEIQTQSAAGCTTSGGASAFTGPCTTTITWPSAFADANYRVSCLGVGIGAGVPLLQGLTAAAIAASVTVQTQQATGVNASFTNITCTGVHQ